MSPSKVKGKGFRVKVVGEYYARSKAVGKEKIIKDYEFMANIPSMNSALSTVKNKLLMPVLKKKYPDYLMYRTYHIVDHEPLDEASRALLKDVEIQYMDRSSLVDFITRNNLPVESRLYPDLFKLRVAVKEANEDEEAYLKKLSLRRADLEMDLEISNLNPELHDQVETPPMGASVAAKVEKAESTPKKIKKTTPAALAKKTGDRVEGLRKDMIKTGEHGPSDQAPEEGADDI